MNKKLLILFLLLLNISETIFIIVLSLLCGFSVGHCMYELMRLKTFQEEIKHFFLSYNKKYGFAIKSTTKLKHK